MSTHLSSVRRRVLVAGILVVVVAGIAAVAAMAASFSGAKVEHWGVLVRNTEGSPVADLRFGPYVNTSAQTGSPTGIGLQPPFGKGSLGIIVGSASEKVAYGDETDFYGDPVQDLTAVGYRVFQTGEDTADGTKLYNLPNITLEIDPNVTGTDHYTSMVWVPAALAAGDQNHWTGYIDATTNGKWYFTGGEGTTTGCSLSSPCTFLGAKQALAANNNGSPPIVLTVAIAKGKDNAFQGAVDGLRLNTHQYDFETDGVHERGL